MEQHDAGAHPLMRRIHDARPGLDGESAASISQSRVRLAQLRAAASSDAAAPVVPADRALAHGARRRPRTLVAAGVAASLVAVGVAIGFVGASTTAPRRTTMPAVHLLAATRAALAAGVSTDIEYTEESMTGPTSPVDGSFESWSFGGRRRIELLDAQGAPTTEFAVSDDGAGRVATVVQYASGTWFTTPHFIAGTLDQYDVATQLRDELSSGQLNEVGTGTVDGQPAIEIDVRSGAFSSPGSLDNPFAIMVPTDVLPATNAPPTPPTPSIAATKVVVTSDVLWVNATSYLPVERVLTLTGGATATTTIQWLPATAANLALLDPVIPSTFTNISQ